MKRKQLEALGDELRGIVRMVPPAARERIARAEAAAATWAGVAVWARGTPTVVAQAATQGEQGMAFVEAVVQAHLLRWERAPQVVEFDATTLDALWGSEVRGEIPHDVLRRLPYPSQYVVVERPVRLELGVLGSVEVVLRGAWLALGTVGGVEDLGAPRPQLAAILHWRVAPHVAGLRMLIERKAAQGGEGGEGGGGVEMARAMVEHMAASPWGTIQPISIPLDAGSVEAGAREVARQVDAPGAGVDALAAHTLASLLGHPTRQGGWHPRALPSQEGITVATTSILAQLAHPVLSLALAIVHEAGGAPAPAVAHGDGARGGVATVPGRRSLARRPTLPPLPVWEVGARWGAQLRAAHAAWGAAKDGGEGGGDEGARRRSPRPHFVRGHWAMQPCGAGRAERVLRWRRPHVRGGEGALPVVGHRAGDDQS